MFTIPSLQRCHLSTLAHSKTFRATMQQIGEHGVGWDTGLDETVALRKSRAANYLCCMFYLSINNVSMYRAKLGNFCYNRFRFSQDKAFCTFRVSIQCCCSTNFYQSICRLCGTSLVLICSWNSGVCWSVITITVMSDNRPLLLRYVWWPMVGLVETVMVGAGWDVHTGVSTSPVTKYIVHCQKCFVLIVNCCYYLFRNGKNLQEED